MAATAAGQTMESWAALLKSFSCNTTPLIFAGATPALLSGLEQWIGGFERVSLTNSRDGLGRASVLETGVTVQDFSTGSEAVAYLLGQGLFQPRRPLPEDARCLVGSNAGINEDAGLDAGCALSLASPVLPSERDVHQMLAAGKIPQTKSLLSAFPNYAAFRQACGPAGLRFTVDVAMADDVAGQLPIEIASAEDWDFYRSLLTDRVLVASQPPSGRRLAVECVVTGSGLIVSPIMQVCFERYWHNTNWIAMSASGNTQEVYGNIISSRAKKIADKLRDSGFRGAFSVEFSEEPSGPRVHRLIPHLSSHSLLSHAVTSLHGGFPLHLLHVAACLGVDIHLPTDKLQARYGLFDDWSVIAIRHNGAQTEMITRAPGSGLYRKEDGALTCVKRDCDWASTVGGHGFFLRLQNAGNYRAPGTLLGLLYVRESAITPEGELTKSAADWIAAFHMEYAGLSISGSSLPAGMTALRRDDVL